MSSQKEINPITYLDSSESLLKKALAICIVNIAGLTSIESLWKESVLSNSPYRTNPLHKHSHASSTIQSKKTLDEYWKIQNEYERLIQICFTTFRETSNDHSGTIMVLNSIIHNMENLQVAITGTHVQSLETNVKCNSDKEKDLRTHFIRTVSDIWYNSHHHSKKRKRCI